MSLIFDRSKLSSEEKQLLATDLSVVPLDAYEEKQKKRGIHANNFSTVKTPINMWLSLSETHLLIPYTYGRIKFNLDNDRAFPRLSETEVVHNVKLRDYQDPIVDQVFATLEEFRTCLLHVRTGWGKTKSAVVVALAANSPVLVQVNREIIARAWEKTFREALADTCLADSVWFVGDKPNYTPISNGYPAITVAMSDRVPKIASGHLRDIGFVIFDEIHALCTPSQVVNLLACQPRYILAESATPFRNDGLSRMFQLIVGEHVVTGESLVPHTLVRFKTQINVELHRGPRGLDFTSLTRDLSVSIERNLLIARLVLANRDRKILIGVRTIKHVKILQEVLQEHQLRVATLYGNDNDYEDSDVLVGIIAKMGYGFDAESTCRNYDGRPFDFLILATSIAESDPYTQFSGRGFRAVNPVIVYLVDKPAVCGSHFRVAKGVAESMGGVVVEIDSSKDALTIPGAFAVQPRRRLIRV